MNEQFFERYPGLRDFYKNPHDLKLVKGYMKVEITRGDVVEKHAATSFYIDASERYALVRAYIGEVSEDHLEIQILSTVRLTEGRHAVMEAGADVYAFYIKSVKTDNGHHEYFSVGNGVLDVAKFSDDSSRFYIKGNIEFMCRVTPFSEEWMKVVAKDFWVDEGE